MILQSSSVALSRFTAQPNTVTITCMFLFDHGTTHFPSYGCHVEVQMSACSAVGWFRAPRSFFGGSTRFHCSARTHYILTFVESQNMLDVVFMPAPFFCIIIHVTQYLRTLLHGYRDDAAPTPCAGAWKLVCPLARIWCATVVVNAGGGYHLKGRFKDWSSFRQASTMELI